MEFMQNANSAEAVDSQEREKLLLDAADKINTTPEDVMKLYPDLLDDELHESHVVAEKLAEELNDQVHFQDRRNLLMAFEMLSRAKFDIWSGVNDFQGEGNAFLEPRDAFAYGLVETFYEVDLRKFNLGWDASRFEYVEMGKELAYELSGMFSIDTYMTLLRTRLDHVLDMAFGRENLFPHGAEVEGAPDAERLINEGHAVYDELVMVRRNGKWEHAPFASHTKGFVEDPVYDTIGIDAFEELYEKPPYADKALMIVPKAEGDIDAVIKIYKAYPDNEDMSISVELNEEKILPFGEVHHAVNCINLNRLSLEPDRPDRKDLQALWKDMKDNGAFNDPVFKAFQHNEGTIPAPELERRPHLVLDPEVAQITLKVLANFHEALSREEMEEEDGPNYRSFNAFKIAYLDFIDLPKEGIEYIRQYTPDVYEKLKDYAIEVSEALKERPVLIETISGRDNRAEIYFDTDKEEIIVFTKDKAKSFSCEAGIKNALKQAFEFSFEEFGMSQEEFKEYSKTDPQVLIHNMVFDVEDLVKKANPPVYDEEQGPEEKNEHTVGLAGPSM